LIQSHRRGKLRVKKTENLRVEIRVERLAATQRMVPGRSTPRRALDAQSLDLIGKIDVSCLSQPSTSRHFEVKQSLAVPSEACSVWDAVLTNKIVPGFRGNGQSENPSHNPHHAPLGSPARTAP
jgi:hypothetical protein